MRKLFLSTAIAVIGFCAASVQAAEFDGAALAGTIQVPNKSSSAVYIIGLSGDPVVAYAGGTGKLAATKPGNGQKINPNSAAVKKYVAHLNSKHDDVLASVGGSGKIYDYSYALNGFAAVLTTAQAEALRQHADVTNVWQDEIRQVTTDSTPNYLGLSGPGEVWDTYGKGEDVIIGVLDTGVWPEHASYSDQIDLSNATGNSGNSNLAYGPAPAGWSGSCQSGEQWSQDDCNNKLIGARYFKDGFSANGNSGLAITEYQSARDSDGHGSHTSSTAGGNEGVANTFGTVSSGIAPRARIAAYKVCWTPRVGDDGCASSDSAAAIDQAVADGVDVINFSIGGASNTFGGADDVAFMFAAAAGVHVATSNGNAGPGPDTTGTPAGVPWLTAVGAAQDDQVFAISLAVSNSPAAGSYLGLEGSGDVTFTQSGDVTGDLEATSPLDACTPVSNSLSGKVAFVIRGVCAFTDKYNNAAAAGASAIVVFNDGTAADRVDPIVMSAPGTTIPGMMIKSTDGFAIMGAGSATALIGPSTLESQDNRIAGFSSRGSNLGAPDIIKPDVAAPGVGIIAAGSGGGDIRISGTSMSSPHVAGIMALLKQANPGWSPAAMKSALMTSGRQNLKKTFGNDDADPFDIGAGHVVPGSAFEPGLVYDLDDNGFAGFGGLLDYAAFSCGNNTQIFSNGTCDFLTSFGFSFDGSDLNMASIGVGALVGTQSIPRTVTSVTPGTTTFTASVNAPAGINVVVTPSVLNLAQGQSADFTVDFTTTGSAVIGDWAFGSLTWNNNAGVSAARSPIAVRPVQLDSPANVNGSGNSGSTSFDIGFGFGGAYTAGTHGIVAATHTAGNVLDDPANDINTALGNGDFTLHFIPANPAAPLARFALFDDETDGADDLDLYVFSDTFAFLGQSGSGTSAEQVDVVGSGSAGFYVVVHGWETDGPDANYTLFSWAPSADAGNMTVTAPASATIGAVETITVNWSGLGTDKYMGAVSHSDGGGLIGVTAVTIDTE